MQLQYNTNGFAHHRLDEALRVLADLGYDGIALTPDVAHCDLATTGADDWARLRALLDRLGLSCSLETGARFVLDPMRKHWPNLASRDDAAAAQRLEYYDRALRMAKALGAPVVSMWSGAMETGTAREEAFQRLAERLDRVLDRAAQEGVAVCLEPEPGMLVESLADLALLRSRLNREDLWTTLDIGHLIVTEPGQPATHLVGAREHLRHVQVDDARRGVHEHLQIGDGEIDFVQVFRELQGMDYRGALAVELSRHSHNAVEAARCALQRLEAARSRAALG